MTDSDNQVIDQLSGRGHRLSSRQRYRLLFVLLVLILFAYALRVFGLSQQSLWYDELATWNRAVIPIQDMFMDLFTVRNHTPFYFLVMRIWSSIGVSEFILRYFSVLLGVLAIPAIYKVGNLIGGYLTAIVAAFIIALSPFHLWYSQEARMYTMLVLLAIGANWFFLLLLREEKRYLWIGYIVCLILGAYTHFMALLILPAHYAFLAIHYRQLKSFFYHWLVAAGITSLVFAFWGGYLMLTGGFREAPISWIPAARLFEPMLTFLSLSNGPSTNPSSIVVYMPMIIVVLAIGYGYTRFGRRGQKKYKDQLPQYTLDYRLLLFWFVVPVLMVYLISQDWPIPQKRSIYVDRYLIIVLPALALLAAQGIVAFTRTPARRWLLPIILLVLIFFNGRTLFNIYFNANFWREDWRAATSQIDTDTRASDVILSRPDHLLPLAYYGVRDVQYVELPSAVEDPLLIEAFEEEMNYRLSTFAPEADRGWLITQFYVNDPHGFPQLRNEKLAQSSSLTPQKDWMDVNYISLAEWEFTGINLTLYDLIGRETAGEG